MALDMDIIPHPSYRLLELRHLKLHHLKLHHLNHQLNHHQEHEVKVHLDAA
ncbi:1466_t:CDS:2 [Entrophospora sp. SA101]|nr:1466_t:CDS:2 [Entrophospora sp. SA101]